jgi:hypothetical protein
VNRDGVDCNGDRTNDAANQRVVPPTDKLSHCFDSSALNKETTAHTDHQLTGGYSIEILVYTFSVIFCFQQTAARHRAKMYES